MNVEDIKKRNERRKVLMKERENEYSLVREIEYNRLVEGSVEDNAYLLSIIEQDEKFKVAAKALDKIMEIELTQDGETMYMNILEIRNIVGVARMKIKTL